ncbi:MAG: LPS export ABC transporter permease LptG [Gammaproteobacteria bacterium]|nr:LPS export ABC transporter permease LptG [Gammaproteobacteria bacterium]
MKLTIIDRYLGKMVILSITMSLMVMLAIQTFITVVDKMRDITDSYGVGSILVYSLLNLPSQAYEIFPIIVLIGTIVGLGKLAGNSELTVLRAAGDSVKAISMSVTKLGSLFILMVFLIGEYLAPDMVRYAEEYRALRLGEVVHVSDGGSFWVKDGQRFIHVDSFANDGSAAQLSYFELNDAGQLSEVLRAAGAESNTDGWQLSDVTRTQFRANRSVSESIDSLALKAGFDQETVGRLMLIPKDIPLTELYGYAGYLESNGMESKSYYLSFWKRILLPLSALGMLLVAVPFVFGSLRERSIGQRIMTGVFLGVIFFILSQMIDHLGVITQFPPIISASIPTVAILLFWGYLLYRADRPA